MDQSGSSGAGLGPLVDFYSRLPKGRAAPRVSGIKARFFNGKNASGAPLVALVAGIFGVSYLLDYHRMCVSFELFYHAHSSKNLIKSSSEYVFDCLSTLVTLSSPQNITRITLIEFCRCGTIRGGAFS